MVSFVQGAILAAGRGERMRAGGGKLPKPLLEVGGEALLMRQARLMVAAGVRRVIAIVNSETFDLIGRRSVEATDKLELKVHDTANSMETMLAFADYLTPGYFLATTVDTVLSRSQFVGFCSRAAAQLTDENSSDRASAGPAARALDGVLAVTRWRGDERPLFVSLSPGAEITRFERDARMFVSAGLYAMHTRLFALAPQAQRPGLAALRQWFAMILERAARLSALEVEAAVDVDEIADLRAANEMLNAAGEA